jgi:riboflavin kinase/FMN adenylyltransferase
MMNIGTNPTVNGKTRSIEVHFFNFKKDIYNFELKIEFLKRLRSEKKYKSLKALRTQLKKDMKNAKEFIDHLNG